MRRLIPSFFLLGLCLLFLTPLYLRAEEVGKHSYWQSARARLETASEAQPLVVLHIGDSHLSGGYMTAPIIERLQTKYGERIRIERIGVPGATYGTFTQERYRERIERIRPDVVVVSLGTNDSYTKRFDEGQMRGNMSNFFSMLREVYGQDVAYLLTTPPFAYLRQRGKARTVRTKRGRKRTTYGIVYQFNPNTEPAVRLIQDFAKAHGMDSYDLYSTISRGNARAEASRWFSEGWLGRDQVHYSVAGYTRIGDLVAQALEERLSTPSDQNL